MEVISTSDWMEHSERSEFTALEDDIRAPTILVVDDDDFVRDAVSLVLSGEGSELLHARSGEEAISLIGTHSTLDGLYTGIQLSGLRDGWDVGEAFYRKWPNKPIVYASGRGWKHARVMPSGRFLSKPFTLEMLIGVLSSY